MKDVSNDHQSTPSSQVAYRTASMSGVASAGLASLIAYWSGAFRMRLAVKITGSPVQRSSPLTAD
jgi:hypothetical protein